MNNNDYWNLTPEELRVLNARKIKPFWTLNHEDDEAVLKWFNENLDSYKELCRDFSQEALENILLYMGESDFSNVTRGFTDIRRDNTSKSNQISVNIAYEFTDLWVNRMSQHKVSTIVRPKNNDTKTRQDAKMKQAILEDFFTRNKIDFTFQKLQLLSRSLGEAYLYITWDDDKGAIHPEYEKATKEGKTVYVKNEDGEDIPLRRIPRIGDVKIELKEGYKVLFDREDYDCTDLVIILSHVEPEKLKTDYPDHDIKVTEDNPFGYIEVRELYFPPNKYLPKGRYVKQIEGAILDNTIYPFSHGLKPLIRLTDIDIPTQNRGRSFLQNIKTQQILTNMVMGANWRNVSISSFVKWLVKKGSVNFKNLSNQANVIEYTSEKPELAKYSGLNQESFAFLELLRKQAEQLSRLQGISLGTPPPNVRSGLQMAQLEEKQQAAITFDIAKRNAAIEDTASMVLSIMADNYKEEDERLITILGKDKSHLVKRINVSALESSHTIEIKNNNGLPEGKYEKLGILTDLKTAFPEVVPDELVIDSFELGQVSRFADYATASVEKAEAENEEMLDSQDIPEPEDYDDHLTEWKIHIAAMRRRSFAEVSDEIKQSFKTHIGIHEMLMEEKAMKNPAFAQKLSMLEGYPVFYELKPSELMEDSALEAQVTEPPALEEIPQGDSIPADLQTQ